MKLQPIPGSRLKFRTENRNGRDIATATIWLEGKPLQEIATFDLGLVDDPGCAGYQGWVDAIGWAFGAFLSKQTGIAGLVMKRQKPHYKGE